MQKRFNKGCHFAVALIVWSMSGTASADELVSNPNRGWFVAGAVGQSHYTSDPGFVTCRCREDDATMVKLGGGYRFGLAGVELWQFDFGRATFGSDALGERTTAHTRASVLAGSLTANFGQRVEASWRVGAAFVNTPDGDGGSKSKTRLYTGASIGYRFTPATSLEFGIDFTTARDSEANPTEIFSSGLGVRQRF